ncbi:MAG: TetR/AcrR family transcriptional regulator [Acidimicrobiales bacterium]|jgi:AcrR family transcriptional regulator|nr:TetR/AcrR family transcriptional regulator [Acidimicrobiales bacterium]
MAGRPRDEALDLKIIEAAVQEFYRVGYAALSLSSIATRADVRPGAVYTRFRDKPEVLAAVLNHISTSREEQMRSLPGDGPYEDLLHAVREVHKSFMDDDVFAIPALTLQNTDEAVGVRKLIREDLKRNRHMTLLRPALIAAKEAGVVGDHVSVSMVSAMIVGSYFSMLLGVDHGDLPDDIPERLLASLGITP